MYRGDALNLFECHTECHRGKLGNTMVSVIAGPWSPESESRWQSMGHFRFWPFHLTWKFEVWSYQAVPGHKLPHIVSSYMTRCWYKRRAWVTSNLSFFYYKNRKVQVQKKDSTRMVRGCGRRGEKKKKEEDRWRCQIHVHRGWCEQSESDRISLIQSPFFPGDRVSILFRWPSSDSLPTNRPRHCNNPRQHMSSIHP